MDFGGDHWKMKPAANANSGFRGPRRGTGRWEPQGHMNRQPQRSNAGGNRYKNVQTYDVQAMANQFRDNLTIATEHQVVKSGCDSNRGGAILANGEEGADGQVVQLADLENSMAVFASHEGPSREQLVSLCNSYAKELKDAEGWEEFVSRCLVHFPIAQGELFADFCVAYFPSIIGNQMFQEAMYSELCQRMSEIINLNAETDDDPSEKSKKEVERRNFCVFLGRLLVWAKWPRGFRHNFKESNQILFAVHSFVDGWLTAIQKQQHSDSLSETQSEEMCARCLLELCESVKRNLWVQHPELVDRIYQTIEELLVCGSSARESEMSIRRRMLKLYVEMQAWTKTGKKRTVSNSTQT